MNGPDAGLALRESEELHRITLLNMSDAVFITNDEGVFTFICPNADVIFEYTSDEVRSMGRISLLLGRELVEPGRLPADGELQNIEHEIETKRGARRAILVHVKRVSIKGGTVLYVCRDVTALKRAEAELRRNEQRLTLALEAASAGTWDWDLSSGAMTWSPETHRLFGHTTTTPPPTFDAFLRRVHPDDRERVARAVTHAMDWGAPYETEFRAIGDDDVERWVMGKGKAVRNGRPLRMLGVFVDLTERHQVEQELRDLGGRLINAHEQERQRLSRDLHDDISQRISLLSAELGQLRRQVTAASGDVQDTVTRLALEAADIGAELHRFSHELHPARLAQLGLEQTIRSFCEELSAAREIAIDVTIDGIPGDLSSEVSLCLYRVAQEALQNVVKHSGARRATLHLRMDESEIVLEIADNGLGFDPKAIRHHATIGIVSMVERARLVNGRLALSSAAGRGTTVEIRIPVATLPSA